MEQKTKQRIALCVLFFQSGLCFSTLAARIPDLKASFQLGEAELGTLLLIRPVGSMLGLPLAGWIVDRFGSRHASTLGTLAFSSSLLLVGLSPSIPTLVVSLVLLGLTSNITSISISAQALVIQKSYGRTIMSSFHGLWSLAGFVGAVVGGLTLSLGVPILTHFLLIAGTVFLSVLLSFRQLTGDVGERSGEFTLARPDRQLLKLGLITFCVMLCEGSVYDWGSVYFQQVVRVPEGLITAGIIAYMAAMAVARFLSDRLANRFGSDAVMQASGLLIFSGMMTTVALPGLAAAIVGFVLIGAGTSSVVPLTYAQAGGSRRLSPGIALAVVSTIGYLGFLMGPPLIGLAAEVLSLRAAFALVALVGLSITVLVSLDQRWSVRRPATQT